MKKISLLILATVAVLAVVMAMGVAAYLLWGLPQEIGTVTVNGKVVDLHGAHAGHWVLATLGILLAALVIVVVVPLVAVIALIAPVTIAAIGLLLAALAVALVLSPLLLLIWWLWKRSTKTTTIGA